MIKRIKIEKLCPNEGQIKDVPANPRTISKEKIEALKVILHAHVWN